MTRRASILELHHDLVERPLADVDGGLDAAAIPPQDVARGDLSLDPAGASPRAAGVGLEVGRHAVPRDLDHHVVVVVAVQRGSLAGIETHLPDADAVVLHQQLRRDIPELARLTHGYLPTPGTVGLTVPRGRQNARV